MNENNDLLYTISNKKQTFSKGQNCIADFLLENYDKAVYLTAAELGKATGVSESTVVRFAIELDFDGYPMLQKELEKLAKTNLSAPKRLEVTTNRLKKKDKHVLKSVMQIDADRIIDSLGQIDENTFDLVVENIIKARKVYVIGARSSSALANFFAFHLNLMIENVQDISSSGSEVFEQIFRIQRNDVCICFSFPRYSQRTIEAMEYAYNQNAITIAITDSEVAPISSFSKYKLIVPCDMISIVDSLVAPMSLINAILVAISLSKKNEIIETYDKLEKLWSENKVYNVKTNQNGTGNEL